MLTPTRKILRHICVYVVPFLKIIFANELYHILNIDLCLFIHLYCCFLSGIFSYISDLITTCRMVFRCFILISLFFYLITIISFFFFLNFIPRYFLSRCKIFHRFISLFSPVNILAYIWLYEMQETKNN